MKILPLLTIFLLCIPLALSLEGKMPLLAVTVIDDEYKGSTAELFLEINEGSGRVFVDTFPLSKLDTQISMRFAKEMACDFLDNGCDNYDFIYTIRAASPIVGGPSAGAAATILTISLLSGTPIKERISITGTINSGGLIGHVGGLKNKIEAAKGFLDTVLIPEGEEENISLEDNSTTTLKDFGNNLSINVIEVSGLSSALEIFTGKDFKPKAKEIEISEFYEKTMKMLAKDLCERNSQFMELILGKEFSLDMQYLRDEGINLSEKSSIAFDNKEFYAAASYCFGSNVKLHQVFLDSKNLSDKKYLALLEELKDKMAGFEKELDSRSIKTITDLESYMIAKERLIEATKYAAETENVSLIYNYAYAKERFFSALSWAAFFGSPGKILDFDEKSLRDTATQRIAEAEERLQYANLYLPFRLNSPREELDLAYEDFNNEEYALALFKATKAKAEVNIILNTLGISTGYIPKLIENKLDAAASVIMKAESKGIFPVLGYSYYEYANNLKESDPSSALLYAEYSLELSNLDIYFKEKRIRLPRVDKKLLIVFILGIILGLIISKIIWISKGKHIARHKKRKK